MNNNEIKSIINFHNGTNELALKKLIEPALLA